MVDVAKAAEVSTSTVSHVVNRTRAVDEATEKRVRRAIAETGWTRNSVARALRRASTESIAITISDIANPHFTSVVRGAEAEASRNRLQLLLGNSDDDPDRELAVVRALVERQVDAFILSPTPSAEEAVLPYLREQRIAVVLIDRLAKAEFDQVRVPDREAMKELVEHLIALGHTRIGLIAGLEALSTTGERVEGYISAHVKAGIDPDPSLIVHGGSRVEPAVAAVTKLMAESRPTALVGANNLMTIGALRALRNLDFEIPDDVALVGFDDFECADLVSPSITTVAQPSYQVGAEAIKLLVRRLRDPHRAREEVRLEPKLMHRESCGCGQIHQR